MYILRLHDFKWRCFWIAFFDGIFENSCLRFAMQMCTSLLPYFSAEVWIKGSGNGLCCFRFTIYCVQHCKISMIPTYNLPLNSTKKKGKKEQRPHLLWHNKIVELSSLTIFHEKNTVRNIFQIQPKCILLQNGPRLLLVK